MSNLTIIEYAGAADVRKPVAGLSVDLAVVRVTGWLRSYPIRTNVSYFH